MKYSHINKGFKIVRCLLFLIILSAPQNSNAQIEVASGIDMSFPLLLNSNNTNLYYKQLSFGIRLELSYKPENTQFFPTFYYSLGQTILPLKQFENNVSTLAFRYENFILNGNLVVTFANNNSIYFIGGIGITNLKEKFPGVSGPNGLAMNSHVDSTSNITKVFPAMSLGLEYVYGGSVNRKVYMSLGLTVQYTILFAGENNYFLTIVDNKQRFVPIASSITGNLIVPNFNITLHYLLGKGIIFWQKKKSSFYL